MTYLFLINKLNNLFTVSRRLGSRLSWRPCVCTVSPAFDWWSASRGVTKNQNSITIVSHRIYLGGCHFNPTFGCQVCTVVVWYFQNFKFALICRQYLHKLAYCEQRNVKQEFTQLKVGNLCSSSNFEVQTTNCTNKENNLEASPFLFSSNIF